MTHVIREAIIAHCRKRGSTRSICPSEVARSLVCDEAAWRALMPAIREAAAELAAEGTIEALQKGARVDARAAGGPIRLRLVQERDPTTSG